MKNRIIPNAVRIWKSLEKSERTEVSTLRKLTQLSEMEIQDALLWLVEQRKVSLAKVENQTYISKQDKVLFFF